MNNNIHSFKTNASVVNTSTISNVLQSIEPGKIISSSPSREDIIIDNSTPSVKYNLTVSSPFTTVRFTSDQQAVSFDFDLTNSPDLVIGDQLLIFFPNSSSSYQFVSGSDFAMFLTSGTYYPDIYIGEDYDNTNFTLLFYWTGSIWTTFGVDDY